MVIFAVLLFYIFVTNFPGGHMVDSKIHVLSLYITMSLYLKAVNRNIFYHVSFIKMKTLIDVCIFMIK